MDIKFTKKRLNDHLSYDWWKYIAILLACIFFWSLVFTMASPRLAISKKFEIFFITNNFSLEESDDLTNGLKEYLSDEFVEFSLNNYIPDDSTTAQVLTARISVKEGDMYAFPFSENSEGNSFGSYVDYNLFSDFETIIADAKQFYNDRITDFEQFKDLYGSQKDYNTDEKLEAGWQVYSQTRLRAKEEAEKLEGYITDYNDVTDENGNQLFYKYSKFTVYNEVNTDNDPITIESEKIWGLNFNLLEDKLSDFNNGGFMYLNSSIVDNDRQPLNVAIGIVSFADDNMPLYYENIAAINYFIQKYYIGSI